MLEHDVDERAAFECGRPEPLVEDVEDREQLLPGIGTSLLYFSLKPASGPQLVASLEERHDEVLLGGEVAVHRLPGHARALDDRIDSNRLDALAREKLVSGRQESL